MLLQNRMLILCILVQADLSYAEDGWLFQKLRNERQNLSSKDYIVRLFGIDTEPREMGNTEFRSSCWLILG